MPIAERAFRGAHAWPMIAPLLDALPASSRHLVDLPYRLCSPSIQAGADARLWTAPDGTAAGFAAWEPYWATLDFLVLPGEMRAEVERAIFKWALPRFREMDRERGRPLPYWVEVRDDDGEREALVAAHGFVLTADYEYVQFHHPLGEAIPVAAPPKGIAIRQMAGEREAAAWAALHRAAFESDAMTEEWRARIPDAPHYSPGLDLVAVTADGSLVGYCLGWWDAAHRQGQVEPLGVAPAYQGLGVGRALLRELLRRFEALGAERVLVETESARPRALRIYESVGFAPRFRVVRKGRWAE